MMFGPFKALPRDASAPVSSFGPFLRCSILRRKAILRSKAIRSWEETNTHKRKLFQIPLQYVSGQEYSMMLGTPCTWKPKQPEANGCSNPLHIGFPGRNVSSECGLDYASPVNTNGNLMPRVGDES